MMRGSVITASILALGLFAVSAWADEQKNETAEDAKAVKEKSGPSRILGALNWGATINDVLETTRVRFESNWQDQVKDLDTIGIDQMRRTMRKKYETVKASLTRFDSARTGYESSIVSKEMLIGKNEALLTVPYGAQQRYYFFRNDRLWKIVVIQDATSSSGLDLFVKQLSADLGTEPTRNQAKVDGKTVLTSADWRDEHTWVSAHDRRSFFNAYLIRFIQIGDGEGYQAERKGQPVAASESRDEDLNALFADGDDDATEAPNVIDQMTGSDHAVDLSAGRMEHAPLQKAPAPASIVKKKQKKKKRTKVAPAPTKKKQKPSDSDEIIY